MEGINTKFNEAGVETNTYVMDDEASQDLKDAIMNAYIKYQLVPPHNHRNNLSERTIQIFIGNFKAGLASLDLYFPISKWEIIVEQGELTINLLCESRSNPKVCLYMFV